MDLKLVDLRYGAEERMRCEEGLERTLAEATSDRLQQGELAGIHRSKEGSCRCDNSHEMPKCTSAGKSADARR